MNVAVRSKLQNKKKKKKKRNVNVGDKRIPTYNVDDIWEREKDLQPKQSNEINTKISKERKSGRETMSRVESERAAKRTSHSVHNTFISIE